MTVIEAFDGLEDVSPLNLFVKPQVGSITGAEPMINDINYLNAGKDGGGGIFHNTLGSGKVLNSYKETYLPSQIITMFFFEKILVVTRSHVFESKLND